ncbi:hypothetical protein [Legionella spiritensis]|uniref:hypothetical protein n=1 Tax=Legionella spiritensis TaxID=452 RepID=UPI000F7095A2|nr:hypothetical protein [Legionella spiritensis]VEG92072.1 Uncharacterised protein [Legionella spiritensis]
MPIDKELFPSIDSKAEISEVTELSEEENVSYKNDELIEGMKVCENPLEIRVLVDVNETLITGDSVTIRYNDNLINYLKEAGFKEIYLFSSHSLVRVSSYIETDKLIKYLEAKDIVVKGVFSTEDVYFDNLAEVWTRFCLADEYYTLQNGGRLSAYAEILKENETEFEKEKIKFASSPIIVKGNKIVEDTAKQIKLSGSQNKYDGKGRLFYLLYNTLLHNGIDWGKNIIVFDDQEYHLNNIAKASEQLLGPHIHQFLSDVKGHGFGSFLSQIDLKEIIKNETIYRLREYLENASENVRNEFKKALFSSDGLKEHYEDFIIQAIKNDKSILQLIGKPNILEEKYLLITQNNRQNPHPFFNQKKLDIFSYALNVDAQIEIIKQLNLLLGSIDPNAHPYNKTEEETKKPEQRIDDYLLKIKEALSTNEFIEYAEQNGLDISQMLKAITEIRKMAVYDKKELKFIIEKEILNNTNINTIKIIVNGFAELSDIFKAIKNKKEKSNQSRLDCAPHIGVTKSQSIKEEVNELLKSGLSKAKFIVTSENESSRISDLNPFQQESYELVKYFKSIQFTAPFIRFTSAEDRWNREIKSFSKNYQEEISKPLSPRETIIELAKLEKRCSKLINKVLKSLDVNKKFFDISSHLNTLNLLNQIIKDINFYSSKYVDIVIEDGLKNDTNNIYWKKLNDIAGNIKKTDISNEILLKGKEAAAINGYDNIQEYVIKLVLTVMIKDMATPKGQQFINDMHAALQRGATLIVKPNITTTQPGMSIAPEKYNGSSFAQIQKEEIRVDTSLKERLEIGVKPSSGDSSILDVPITIPKDKYDSENIVELMSKPDMLYSFLSIMMSGTITFNDNEISYMPFQLELLHELIHALHNAQGINYRNIPLSSTEKNRWKNYEEYVTISGAEICEADFSPLYGATPRDNHAGKSARDLFDEKSRDPENSLKKLIDKSTDKFKEDKVQSRSLESTLPY